MTDRTQFEAMLEALINEDQETAQEIFHNIVVAKSREIYEELLAEDFDVAEANGDDEDEDKEEDTNEAFGEEDSEESDAADDEEGSDDEEGADDSEDDGEATGGDATDDFVSDVSDDAGEDDSEGGDVEDRVLDLEDALEELKAEFEQLMAGEEGEEHMGGDDMGMDAEPEMGADMGAEPAMGSEEDEVAQFMEYVNKVALPKHGDNGVNTKSAVAGKNDMGGTTANIAKSFSTEKGGTQGGLLKPTTSPQDGGNINVPGGNAGKTAFKKKEPGHGAEKKGSGENAANTKPIIGGKK